MEGNNIYISTVYYQVESHNYFRRDKSPSPKKPSITREIRSIKSESKSSRKSKMTEKEVELEKKMERNRQNKLYLQQAIYLLSIKHFFNLCNIICPNGEFLRWWEWYLKTGTWYLNLFRNVWSWSQVSRIISKNYDYVTFSRSRFNVAWISVKRDLGRALITLWPISYRKCW